MDKQARSSWPLLLVEDLSIGFLDEEGKTIAITDRINLRLDAGEIQGLVGESGCGKSVTALGILRLLPQPAGKILGGRISFRGKDLLLLSPAELRKIRGSRIAMIFQEPSAALNPLMRIGDQLHELFSYHADAALPSPQKRVLELLERVGFAEPDRILRSWPHELSGGMLQRVMIALALLLKPAILIADEPTTALDVTVQAQIMELLVELQREEGSAVLLITHNLGLVAQYADSLAVMYAGRIVEEASVADFLKNPKHPYSQGLMAALPLWNRSQSNGTQKRLQPIEGQVPRPSEFPEGCRFAPRCSLFREICKKRPELQVLSPLHTTAKSRAHRHSVACFHYGHPQKW